MKFKYTLNKKWVSRIACMEEFANGATQVSIETRDGKVHVGILISNSTWIIAMRGQSDLPFRLKDIVEIYQTDEDKNPTQRGGWEYWDNWE